MSLRIAGPSSVFARQIDDAVRIPDRHFGCRKIGELKLLGIDNVVSAVFAGERGGAVGPDNEFPHLKLFGGDALFGQLKKRDGVEEPICLDRVS
jgi:hypothetical protein